MANSNKPYTRNSKTFNKKDITQFFHKLLIKKTVLFSSILVVLILLFLIFTTIFLYSNVRRSLMDMWMVQFS